tara:strand:+ start:122 stop:379 length:258 start_codon:yes stop_codon:yes gene_type:complete
MIDLPPKPPCENEELDGGEGWRETPGLNPEEFGPCDFCKQEIKVHAKNISYYGEKPHETKVRVNCHLCNECFAIAAMIGRPIPTY